MKELSYEYLYKLAFIDVLTGLKNRNAYEEKKKELREPAVGLENLTAVIIDIDNLRLINNDFGHYSGDEAIICVAEAIVEAFGDESFSYRIGGDEFAVFVYSDCDKKIDEFRSVINLRSRSFRYPLNVSIGTAEYVKGKNQNIDEILKICDDNMYLEKRKHRQSKQQ